MGEEITVCMLKSFSEVTPLLRLMNGELCYEGMKEFEAYQSKGRTFFRHRKTRETYQLTALIEKVGKTEVIKGKDFVDLKKIED